MKTFEEMKSVLKQDLLELEKLAGSVPSTIEKRHVKVQETCSRSANNPQPVHLRAQW